MQTYIVIKSKFLLNDKLEKKLVNKPSYDEKVKKI